LQMQSREPTIGEPATVVPARSASSPERDFPGLREGQQLPIQSTPCQAGHQVSYPQDSCLPSNNAAIFCLSISRARNGRERTAACDMSRTSPISAGDNSWIVESAITSRNCVGNPVIIRPIRLLISADSRDCSASPEVVFA